MLRGRILQDDLFASFASPCTSPEHLTVRTDPQAARISFVHSNEILGSRRHPVSNPSKNICGPACQKRVVLVPAYRCSCGIDCSSWHAVAPSGDRLSEDWGQRLSLPPRSHAHSPKMPQNPKAQPLPEPCKLPHSFHKHRNARRLTSPASAPETKTEPAGRSSFPACLLPQIFDAFGCEHNAPTTGQTNKDPCLLVTYDRKRVPHSLCRASLSIRFVSQGPFDVPVARPKLPLVINVPVNSTPWRTLHPGKAGKGPRKPRM